MEGINVTELANKELISPLQDMVKDIRVKNNPETLKKEQSLGWNFKDKLLFGTGLQEKQSKPSLSFQNTDVSSAYANVGGEYIAKYDSYKRGRDNAEFNALHQSSGDKWVNGIEKALLKTGSAVLGGTVGLVYGVGAALSDGSFSSIYDNRFSNTLADLDEKLQYQLPNYYSKQEQDKGLFGQMGTHNFWADKFLGGLSFTAGAIISEGIWAYATGGLSLAKLGAEAGTRAASRWGVEALGETAALQGLSKYKGIYRTMQSATLQAGKISKALPNALGKTGEFLSSVGVLARSAGYEASTEALQYKREATENFYQNFMALNGREPNKKDIEDFNVNLESSSNAVFKTNMAILMPSNLVTMGHILNIKSPIKTGFSDFLNKKAFGYGIEKTADKAGKITYNALKGSTGQKIARTAFNYVIKPSLSEGLFEEGLQGVTTKTASKWLEHSYNPKYSAENLDAVGAFYESLGEQYGTKEGWVENGLGMIIGIVGGSVNAVSESKAKNKELDYQASVATTFQTGNLQSMILPNRIQSANRMAGFSEDAKVEAQKGNISKAALAQKSSLLTFINAKLVMGEGISDIVGEVKLGLDSTTEDQWKSAGIDVDNIDTHKEETLKEFEDLAKEWKSNKTYWGYMIGQKIQGEQDLDTQIGGDILNAKVGGAQAIIEALTWQSTIGESANKQMKDAQEVINRELGSEYSKVMKLNSLVRDKSTKLKKEINISTRAYKVELARRDSLVAKIAKLNNAPKQPEAANRPAGKQLGVLNQALLESESKLAELDIKLEGYAEQINSSESYKSELETVEFSSQDLSTDLIKGQDLVSLQDNVKKFDTILSTLEATNPQKSTYIRDLLKEYSDSEEVFLQNQATQRIVSDPNFKIQQINSWIQGKVKRNSKMNENTKEWLTETLETYKRSKVASMAEQSDIILEEEKQSRIAEIKKELEDNEDLDEAQIKKLEEELESLEKNEEVVIPEDKGEIKAKTRKQEITDEITELETKRKEELANVQTTPPQDISSLSQEDFAVFLQDNYADKLSQGQIYNLLTVRSELRQAMLNESPEEWAKRFERNEDFKQQHNNIDNNKELRGTSNPAWTGISINDPSNKATEGRHKGYITVSVNSARDLAINVEQTFKDLYEELKNAGYNGHLKMPSTFSDLLTRFDNIVIHGATEADVALALPIIEKYLGGKGLTVEGKKVGLDAKDSSGKETSHTNLLAEKVKNKQLTPNNTTSSNSETKEIEKIEEVYLEDITKQIDNIQPIELALLGDRDGAEDIILEKTESDKEATKQSKLHESIRKDLEALNELLNCK